MRLVLAIAVLAASSASAHAAEDRYGPRRAPAPSVAVAAAPTTQPYSGATLGWSGKSAAPTPPAAQAAAPVRPGLMPGGLYRASAPVAPTPVAVAAPPPAPAAFAAATPPAAPTSLYSRPAAQTPVDRLPPPPSPTAVQGGLYASGGPRFYSVHRPYGETPDPIPAVPAGERLAFRPEASLAGEVSLSGVGAGVRDPDSPLDDSMAGVGAADAQEEADRAAKREAERTAARRAAAAGSGQ